MEEVGRAGMCRRHPGVSTCLSCVGIPRRPSGLSSSVDCVLYFAVTWVESRLTPGPLTSTFFICKMECGTTWTVSLCRAGSAPSGKQPQAPGRSEQQLGAFSDRAGTQRRSRRLLCKAILMGVCYSRGRRLSLLMRTGLRKLHGGLNLPSQEALGRQEWCFPGGGICTVKPTKDNREDSEDPEGGGH